MPMSSSALRELFVQRIFNGLKREFGDVSGVSGYQPVTDEYWMKLSKAIADIAIDAVSHIQGNADVLPGIQVTTAGAPTNHTGATVSKGKII